RVRALARRQAPDTRPALRILDRASTRLSGLTGLRGLLPEEAGSELWQDLQYSKICGRAECIDPHVNPAFTRATKRTRWWEGKVQGWSGEQGVRVQGVGITITSGFPVSQFLRGTIPLSDLAATRIVPVVVVVDGQVALADGICGRHDLGRARIVENVILDH